jgi:hypothetical protein
MLARHIVVDADVDKEQYKALPISPEARNRIEELHTALSEDNVYTQEDRQALRQLIALETELEGRVQGAREQALLNSFDNYTNMVRESYKGQTLYRYTPDGDIVQESGPGQAALKWLAIHSKARVDSGDPFYPPWNTQTRMTLDRYFTPPTSQLLVEKLDRATSTTPQWSRALGDRLASLMQEGAPYAHLIKPLWQKSVEGLVTTEGKPLKVPEPSGDEVLGIASRNTQGLIQMLALEHALDMAVAGDWGRVPISRLMPVTGMGGQTLTGAAARVQSLANTYYAQMSQQQGLDGWAHPSLEEMIDIDLTPLPSDTVTVAGGGSANFNVARSTARIMDLADLGTVVTPTAEAADPTIFEPPAWVAAMGPSFSLPLSTYGAGVDEPTRDQELQEIQKQIDDGFDPDTLTGDRRRLWEEAHTPVEEEPLPRTPDVPDNPGVPDTSSWDPFEVLQVKALAENLLRDGAGLLGGNVTEPMFRAKLGNLYPNTVLDIWLGLTRDQRAYILDIVELELQEREANAAGQTP